MEETVQPQQQEQINSIVVKEKKEQIARIWEKLVNTGVKVEKTKIKAMPIMLKVAGFFVPEIAPITGAISLFLKTKSGKKWMEAQQKCMDAAGDVLKGNIDGATEKISETMEGIDDEFLQDVKDLVDKVGGRSK